MGRLFAALVPLRLPPSPAVTSERPWDFAPAGATRAFRSPWTFGYHLLGMRGGQAMLSKKALSDLPSPLGEGGTKPDEVLAAGGVLFKRAPPALFVNSPYPVLLFPFSRSPSYPFPSIGNRASWMRPSSWRVIHVSGTRSPSRMRAAVSREAVRW